MAEEILESLRNLYIEDSVETRLNKFAEDLRLLRSRSSGRRVGRNVRFLEQLDLLLRGLYEFLGSKRKLKKEILQNGICLSTGTQHGVHLASIMRKDKSRIISLRIAKRFEFVKICLVKVF